MRLETFFEKFELFADAPNAVRKMRELVVDLAVKGKLVPNNPNDVAIRLNMGGGSNHGLNPPNWRSGLLGDAITLEYGDNLPAAKRSGSGEYPVYGSNGIVGTHDSFLTKEPAIIVGRKGSVGALHIANGPSWTTDVAYFVRAPSELDLRFTYYLLSSLRLDVLGKGIKPGLSRKEAYVLPVALPPLAEQKRIVAKVDELMALCDRLETQQRERNIRHAELARASLARFAKGPTPANLDYLFHQSYPIPPADLRKAILSLAVQGKLIPQDPNDEPAVALLSRIAAHKVKLAQEGKFRGLTSASPMDKKDGGLEIPAIWTWVRFGEIMINRDGERVPVSKEERSAKAKTYDYYGASGVIDKIDSYLFDKPLLLIGEDGANLLSRSTPIAYMARGKYWVNNHAHVLDGISEDLLQYIELYVNAITLEPYVTGSAQPKMNQAKMNSIPIALPPLAEQRRIVAKVDQLMAMVDRLETQLSDANTKSTALLDAVIHELLNPSAEIIDLTAYRAAVGCYAIWKMGSKRYFGRTAAMKVFYLAQAHVGLELGLQPMREAAGPLDPWIYRFEEQGERSNWFKVVENTTASGKKKIEYRPGQGIAEQSAQAERLLSASQRKDLDRLFDLMADKKTDEAEIIATLFAAWNDFLIDGQTPGDDEIVTEVREHWHESKQRFTPQQLRQWLAWMRDNDLVPKGKLPRTVHQTDMFAD